MAKSKTTKTTAKTGEHPRKSTGNVVEPGDGYLDNGNPNLAPSAGYEAAYPVQYADESDSNFEIRVNEFERRRNHAEQIEAGGATLEQRKEDLELKHEAELANLDRQEATRPK